MRGNRARPTGKAGSHPELVLLDPRNVEEFGIHCVGDGKHPGHAPKVEWFRRQFKRGLRIRMLYSREARKSVGFIEYAPGECAWRAVEAPGYLVVHCIWVKSAGRGYGSRLVEAVVADARREGKKGVAVVTSTGPWCAKAAIFEKCGFEAIAERPPFRLHVRRLKKSAGAPTFVEGSPATSRSAVTFRYSYQCPYVTKAVDELPAEARARGVELELIPIRTAREARRSPTPYGVTSLMVGSKVVADHAISRTRFRNILRQEGLTR